MFHRLLLEGRRLLLLGSGLFSLLISPRPALAADAWPYQLRPWTTADGLPQSRIACLKQTRDGYLWIGTWSGLARFDGTRFTVFNQLNTPEFSGERGECINALAEDADGTLWIGTGQGLVGYRDQGFHRYQQPEGIPDLLVGHLIPARAGGVWFLAGNSYVKFKAEKVQVARRISEVGRTYALLEQPDGGLDIFLENLWLTLAADGNNLRTNSVAIPEGLRWLATGVGRRGEIGFGADHGLWVVENRTNIQWRQAITAPENLGSIWQIRSGEWWSSDPRFGIRRFGPAIAQPLDCGTPWVYGAAVCLEEDAEGSIWLGTERGLVQLRRQPFQTIANLPGLADVAVKALCEDRSGAMWFAGDQGFSRLVAGASQPEAVGYSQFQAPTTSMYPSAQQGVWMSKQGAGLWRYVDRGFQEVLPQARLEGLVGAMLQDRSNQLWLGCSQALLKFDASTQTLSNLTARFPTLHTIASLLEDEDGSLWVGTSGAGLSHLTGARLETHSAANGLRGRFVNGLCQDGGGTIWCATEEGVGALRKGRWFMFASRHGLPEVSFNSILEDAFGNLWLGGLRGIYRADRTQLEAVMNGRMAQAQFLAFTTADGLLSAETNGGDRQPGAWKAQDGRLWFATIRGAAVMNPLLVQSNLATISAPPPAVIELVKADETVVFGWDAALDKNAAKLNASANAGKETLQVAPGRGHLVEFQYTVNSFLDAEHQKFRYRLVGYDKAWREKVGERVIHYANLRPGHYRFEVEAANHHNVWSREPAVFAFSLAPHFWQTWIFYVVCGGVVVGLVVGVQAYRLNWQRQLLKVEEQRTVANERARIARDLHDDLGTALTGLAFELDVLRRESSASARWADRLQNTAARVRTLAERMREVVWTVNPECDTVSSLADFLEQQVEQVLRGSELRVRLNFPEHIPAVPLGAEARHQLALSVREALANVIRHAAAREVVVSLAVDEFELIVRVQDDGCGLAAVSSTGNGLKNLRKRMETVNGSFVFESKPEAGTTVTFRLRLPEPGGRA